MKFSIVIPIYNSESILPVLIPEVCNIMQSRGFNYQIVAVDDCSTDDTWQTLVSLKKEYAQLHAIRLAKNVGQWLATTCGINKAKGDVIITIDDDREYDSHDIVELIDFFEGNDYALVYGVPQGKGRKNLSYKVFYPLRNMLQNLLTGQGNTESFRIFSRSIMQNPNPKVRLNSFYIDAYFKHVLHRSSIGYIDVSYHQRHSGRSNFSLWKKLAASAKFGPEYYAKPLSWMVVVSILLAVIDLLKLYTYWPPLVYLQLMIPYLFLLAFVVIAFYLAQIYLMLKGKPVYIILKELL